MRGLITLGFLAVMSNSIAQDVSLDKKLGAENALKVEQEMGIYRHDSLHNLVNSIGKKLVSELKNNPFEFRFFLVDTPEPNAFALPGGYVYVTRGILPLIQTEDELAGIMAHEIIHVTQRHSIKQMKKSIVGGILMIPGNVLNAATGTNIGNVLNIPIGITSQAFISKYSRGHESEADKLGIQLAARAGYKTDALADALGRLSKTIEEYTGEPEKKGYFADHPYTPSRVTAIRKSAPDFKPVNPSPVTASHDEFLRKFNGLVFGLNPQQGMFIDSLFVHPDLGIAWFTPPGWSTMNKPVVAGAVARKGDGIVIMQGSSERKSAREIGEEVKAKVASSKDIQLDHVTDTVINALPAYVLCAKSVGNNQVAFLEIIWIQHRESVFQLTGIATAATRGNMRKSLTSFGEATGDELELIKLYELRVVKANSNETITQLSQRTDNKLKPSLTALINSRSLESKLPEGSLVKIVKGSIYHPNR
jgi:predicted Zn-dependent protease